MINPEKTIPTKSSNAENWVEWHKLLKRRYSKKTANYLFVIAWERRGSYSANTSFLRDYLKKQGIELTGNMFIQLEDAASDVFDFVGDVFTMGKYAGYGVLALIFGSAIFILIAILKDPVKSASTAVAIRTGGMMK